MALGDAETTDFWTEFLRSLRERGLKVATDADPLGVILVTSDAHAGLKAAVKAILPGAGWQRCRVHFARNVTQKIGSARSKPVNALISTIFAQTTTEAVTAQYQAVTDSLRGSFPEIAAMLEAAEPDMTGFAALPREHWQKVWSNNPSVILSHWPGWCLDLRFFVLDVSGTRVFGGVSGLVVRGGFRVGLGRVARAGRRGLGRGRAAVAGCRPPVRRSFGVRVAGVA
jgi:hypothetical protein